MNNTNIATLALTAQLKMNAKEISKELEQNIDLVEKNSGQIDLHLNDESIKKDLDAIESLITKKLKNVDLTSQLSKIVNVFADPTKGAQDYADVIKTVADNLTLLSQIGSSKLFSEGTSKQTIQYLKMLPYFDSKQIEKLIDQITQINSAKEALNEAKESTRGNLEASVEEFKITLDNINDIVKQQKISYKSSEQVGAALGLDEQQVKENLLVLRDYSQLLGLAETLIERRKQLGKIDIVDKAKESLKINNQLLDVYKLLSKAENDLQTKLGVKKDNLFSSNIFKDATGKLIQINEFNQKMNQALNLLVDKDKTIVKLQNSVLNSETNLLRTLENFSVNVSEKVVTTAENAVKSAQEVMAATNEASGKRKSNGNNQGTEGTEGTGQSNSGTQASDEGTTSGSEGDSVPVSISPDFSPEEFIAQIHDLLIDHHVDVEVEPTIDPQEFVDTIQTKLKGINVDLDVNGILSNLSGGSPSFGMDFGKMLEQWNQADKIMKGEATLAERGAFVNTKTGYISNAFVFDKQHEISNKIMKELLDACEQEVDAALHSHPDNYAAFSPEDINVALSEAREKLSYSIIKTFNEVAVLNTDLLRTKDVSNLSTEYNDLWNRTIQEKLNSTLESLIFDSKEEKTKKGLDYSSFITEIYNKLSDSIKNTVLPEEGIKFDNKILSNMLSSAAKSMIDLLPDAIERGDDYQAQLEEFITEDILDTLATYFDNNKIKKPLTDDSYSFIENSVSATVKKMLKNALANSENFINKSTLSFKDIYQKIGQEALKKVLSKYFSNIEEVFQIFPIEDYIKQHTTIPTGQGVSSTESGQVPVETDVSPSIIPAEFIQKIEEKLNGEEKVDVGITPKVDITPDINIDDFVKEAETQLAGSKINVNIAPVSDTSADDSSVSSVIEDQNKIQEEIKETDEITQRVLYHYGLLSSYKGGKKSHQFGDEITAYKEGKSNGGRGWADGTGTYVTNDFTEFDKITTTEDFKEFFALDVSKLKMYEAHIEEEAQKFYEFQHKLEQFVLACGSGYSGFDDNISDVTSESLYAEAKSIFSKYPEIFNGIFKDFEDFDNFIDEMINLVSESGMNENGFESKNAKKFMEFKKNNGVDDIKTRFLKRLGFQGIDLSGTSYGGIQSGSVIFDIDTAPIIAKGKTIQEVLDAIGVKAEDTRYKVQEVSEVKTDSPIEDASQEVTPQIDVTPLLSSPEDFANQVTEQLSGVSAQIDVSPNIGGKNKDSSPKDGNTSAFTDEELEEYKKIQTLQVLVDKYKLALTEIENIKLMPETEETKKRFEQLTKLVENYKKELVVATGMNINDSSWSIDATGRSTITGLVSREDEQIIRDAVFSIDRMSVVASTIDYSGLESILDIIEKIDNAVQSTFNKLNPELQVSKDYVGELKYKLVELADLNEEKLILKVNSKDFDLIQKDIDNIISKYPELERFRDIIGIDKAKSFINTSEWNNFLATLPKAQSYLNSLKSLTNNTEETNTTISVSPIFDTSGFISGVQDELNQANLVATVSINPETGYINKIQGELDLSSFYIYASIILNNLDNEIQRIVQNSNFKSQDGSDLVLDFSKSFDPSLLQDVEKLGTTLSNIVKELQEKIKLIEEEENKVKSSLPNEINEFEKLRQKIATINSFLDKKNKAIINEEKLVGQLIPKEVNEFEKFRLKLVAIEATLRNIVGLYQQMPTTPPPIPNSNPSGGQGGAGSGSGGGNGNGGQNGNGSGGNKVDPLVEAYEKLAKIEKNRRKLLKKKEINKLTDLEAANLKVLEEEYNKYIQVIQAANATTKEQTEAKNNYLKVQKEVDDYLSAYSDKNNQEYRDVFSLEQKADKLRQKEKEKIQPFIDNGTGQSIDYIKVIDTIDLKISELKNKLPIDFTDPNEVNDLERIKQEIDDLIEDANSNKYSPVDDNVRKTLEKDFLRWVNNNSAVKNAYKSDIEEIINSFSNVKTIQQLDELKEKINGLKITAESAGKTGKSFYDGLISRAKSLGQYLSTFVSFYKVIDILKTGISYIKEYDTEMTNLRKVAQGTREEIDNFGKSSYIVADSIGATNNAVIEATTEWARLGYTIQEASDLAKASTIYSNVGEIDATTATTDLVSILKAFDMESEKVMTVVDSLNEVGNNYAVSSAQLGEILEKSSAALTVSGDSFDQVVAMGAAMNEITQDASVTGTTLKMLGLRIRGASTEIEEMGESTDGMAVSSSKLREEIKALTNIDGTGGFDIMKNNDEFKTTYDIIKGISEVWNDMSNVNQSALLELIAGKNRAQGAAALIKNFKKAEEALISSQNAAGSATKENQKYMDSIEGRINILSNKWKDLWVGDASIGAYKIVIDFLTKVASFANTIGLLPSLAISIGTITFLVQSLKVGSVIKTWEDLRTIIYTWGDDAYKAILKVIAAQKASILATGGQITAWTVLKGVISAAGAKVWAFLGTPLGKFVLLAGVIGGCAVAFDAIYESAKKAAEASEELIGTFKDFQSQSSANIATLNNLKDRFNELSEGVGGLNQNWSLTEEEYEEYLDISNQIAEIMPGLVSYYDEEGNAVIRLKDNVEDLTEAYKEYIQQRAQDYLLEGDEEGNKVSSVFDDYRNNVGNENTLAYVAQIGNYSSLFDSYEKLEKRMKLTGTKETLTNAYAMNYDQFKEFIEGTYSDYSIEKLQVTYLKKLLKEAGYNAKEITEETFNQIHGVIGSRLDSIDAQLNEYTKKVSTVIQEIFFGDSRYWDLDETYEGLSNGLSNIINNLSPQLIADLGLQGEVGAKAFVNKLLAALEEDDTLANSITSLFNLNINDLPINDAQSKVNDLVGKIVSGLSENGIKLSNEQVLSMFGLEDVNAVADNYNKLLSETAQKVSGATSFDYEHNTEKAAKSKEIYETLDKFAQDYSINTQNEIAAFAECLKEANYDIEAAMAKYLDKKANNELFSYIDNAEKIDDLQSKVSDFGSTLENAFSGDIGASEYIDLLQAMSKVGIDVSAIKTTEDMKDAMQDYADKIWKTIESELEAIDASDELKQAFKDMYSEALEGAQSMDIVCNRLNDIQSAYETVVSAFEDYTKNGYLSIDNLTSLLALDDRYLAALMTEDGQLRINADSYITLANAQLDAAEAQAYLDATTSIDAIIDVAEGRYNEAAATYELANSYITAASAAADYAEKLAYVKQIEGIDTSAVDNVEAALQAKLALINQARLGIGKNYSGKASGASSDKNDYAELFDFFERRIEVLNDAIELLDSNLENVIGSVAKNKLLSQQTAIVEEEYKNYTDALGMYQTAADYYFNQLSADMQKKIKDGAVDLTALIGANGEKVNETLSKYQEWANKVADCRKELAKLKEEIRQIELEKFNNIIEDYTNQFDIFSNSLDLLDKQIGLFEEAGQLIGEAFYSEQIKHYQKQINILEEEKTKLVKQLEDALASGRIEAGTDEWLEMVNAVTELEGSILDCKTSIEEMDNAILQLHWDTFDRIQEKISGISEEANNLAELFNDFTDIEVSDGKGTWTDEALAVLGLYAQQYEAAKYQAEQYGEAINDLKKQYAEGKYSTTEYFEKLSELTSGQWDAINAAESIEDAIISLNETRINEEIEVINDEIDAYKELTDAQIENLQSKKDLHDYEKSIAEKTKSIIDIERQLAAMQYDTSAAAKAKRKQLEEQLAEAQEDLAETEYDHSIEQQEEGLNKQYEAFEKEKNDEIELLEESLKNRELIITQSFETIKANTEIIGTQISQIAQANGVIVSDALITAWKSGENAIASYGQTLDAKTSTFIGNLQTVENEMYILQSNANTTASAVAGIFTQNAQGLLDELYKSQFSIENVKNTADVLQQSLFNALNGGYDVSGIVGALNKITEAANIAAGALRSMSGSFNVPTTKVPTTKVTLPGGTALAGVSKVLEMIEDTTASDDKIINYLNSLDDKNKEPSIKINNGILSISKYAKGGIITKDDNNPLNQIAKAVGEDTLIAAKEHESVLTPIQTEAMLKLAPFMEKFVDSIPASVPNIVRKIGSYANSAQSNNNVQIGSLVTVNGNIDDGNMQKITGIVKQEIQNTFGKWNRDFKYT